MDDPLTRAALLASLPAVGFVPPEDAAPWFRPARPARPGPRPRTTVEPVAAWEPEGDAASVSAAVAAFRTAVAGNAATVGYEIREPWLVMWLARAALLSLVILLLLCLLSNFFT